MKQRFYEVFRVKLKKFFVTLYGTLFNYFFYYRKIQNEKSLFTKHHFKLFWIISGQFDKNPEKNPKIRSFNYFTLWNKYLIHSEINLIHSEIILFHSELNIYFTVWNNWIFAKISSNFFWILAGFFFKNQQFTMCL